MTLKREKKVCTEKDYWESFKNTCFLDQNCKKTIGKHAKISETIDFLCHEKKTGQQDQMYKYPSGATNPADASKI